MPMYIVYGWIQYEKRSQKIINLMYKEKRYIFKKKLIHKYHCQNYFNSITIKYIQEVEMELMPELFLWKLRVAKFNISERKFM